MSMQTAEGIAAWCESNQIDLTPETATPTNSDNSESTGRGNTKISARAWLLVLNNPIDHNITHIDQLTDLWAHLKCAGWVIQLEQGAEGTPHYQGVVRFENQIQFSTIRALLPAIHWEVCRSWKAQIHYCCKADTRINGPWIHNVKITPPESIRTISVLRPWQETIDNTISTQLEAQDDRTINWYWEADGNVGKTALAKYLCVKHKHLNPIYLCGKASDIKCAIAKMVQKETPPKLCIFGFVRDMESYISYQGIEEAKDGIFFSGKYESGMCMYNSPIVVCLSNFEPDQDRMSLDRWNVVDIKLMC